METDLHFRKIALAAGWIMQVGDRPGSWETHYNNPGEYIRP